MIFGWHLGLEITVDAQGIVNPSRNFTVKSWQTEILKTILFRQGQGIGVDELLAEIEDQETRAETDASFTKSASANQGRSNRERRTRQVSGYCR